MFSAILVSASVSYLFKYWIATHFLDACLEILVSDSKLLKHW